MCYDFQNSDIIKNAVMKGINCELTGKIKCQITDMHYGQNTHLIKLYHATATLALQTISRIIITLSRLITPQGETAPVHSLHKGNE